jgi:nitronate monooxygenase
MTPPTPLALSSAPGARSEGDQLTAKIAIPSYEENGVPAAADDAAPAAAAVRQAASGGEPEINALLRKMFQMGASGVQMATRFVATNECDAAPAFKEAYLNAREEDIIIIESPVGMPGRAIKNKFIEDINRGEKKTL